MDSSAPFAESGILPQSLRRRSARGVVVMLGAQSFRFVLQIGSQLILARLLDPAAFGLVAMVAPIWGLVLIFVDLGLAQAIVQRAEISNRELSALFWVATTITGTLTLLMVLAAPLLALLYNDPRVTGIAMSLAALVLISGLTIVPKAILSRRMKFGALSFIDMFCAISGVAVGVAFAWLEYGYWALVFAQAVSSISSLLLTWIIARWMPTSAFTWSEVKPFLHFGANVSGVNLAMYVTSSIDNVIVGAVAGSVALGLYDRGYRLVVQPLVQLIFPIGQVAVPLLSRLLPSEAAYRDAYLTVLQFLLFATVPGLIFGISLHSPIVEILLGPRWAAADQVVAWFCFGALVSPIYTSLSWLFMTQNRTSEQLFFTTITCVVDISAVLIGLRWGVVGVACSGALSYVFIQTPLLVWAVTRRGAINRRQFLTTLFPFGLAGAVSAILLENAKGFFPILNIGALAVLLGASYLSVLLILLCFRSSRHFFHRAWKSRSIFLPGQSLDALQA